MNGWAIVSGARAGSTRGPAPARTAGLDFNLPVHALRAEPRLGMGTIRAPGENRVAGCKDRRAGPADDDKNSLGWTNGARGVWTSWCDVMTIAQPFMAGSSVNQT